MGTGFSCDDGGLFCPFWNTVGYRGPTATQNVAGGRFAAATQRDAENGRSGRRRRAKPLKWERPRAGQSVPRQFPIFHGCGEMGPPHRVLQCSAAFCVARAARLRPSASLLDMRAQLYVMRDRLPEHRRRSLAAARDDTDVRSDDNRQRAAPVPRSRFLVPTSPLPARTTVSDETSLTSSLASRSNSCPVPTSPTRR